jgi:hypothetical protein
LDLAAEKGAAVIAIKPMCMGAWPKDAPKARNWWYRTTETPEEISVALRFSLSLKGVVAGIPPSFAELVDRALTAAADYQPATTADKDQLRALAAKCESVFLREDTPPATEGTAHIPSSPYPDHPHGCPMEA